MILIFLSCQEHNKTSENQPDAVRDLLIDRSFWKTKSVENAQNKLTNIHRFTITNTSHQYAYRTIKVRFDYYDRDHRKIDESIRVLERTVEPRAAIKIDSVEAGSAKDATITATATIVNASTVSN
ncbi:hypothetical protein [Spirosoma sp.]|uniref:hypothetical protein n=1 Tax=Spirosoma sp. TaxID=1899569 RepID=UPI003B3ADCA8